MFGPTMSFFSGSMLAATVFGNHTFSVDTPRPFSHDRPDRQSNGASDDVHFTEQTR
jgi:hypothetical protein